MVRLLLRAKADALLGEPVLDLVADDETESGACFRVQHLLCGHRACIYCYRLTCLDEVKPKLRPYLSR